MTTTLPHASTISHPIWRLPARSAWISLAGGCFILFSVGALEGVRSAGAGGGGAGPGW
jgi:hypothetical protein